MSAKFAFVSTFALMLLLNGFAAGAITHSITTKSNQPTISASLVSSGQRTEEEKKDGDKKNELVAVNIHQPTYMKPASLHHFGKQHKSYRYRTNA